MHKNDHIIKLIYIIYMHVKDPVVSMSEFGGLQKHERTQHALKSGRIISMMIVVTLRKKKE